MSKTLTAFLVLMVFGLKGIAQKIFVPGYIVKNSGDTSRGLLQEEMRKDLLTQVQFKTDISSPAKVFTVDDVKSFKYESGDMYKKISFLDISGDSDIHATCFGKQLVEGRYSLFDFESKGSLFFLLTVAPDSYLLYDAVYYANGEEKEEGSYVAQLTLLSNECKYDFFQPNQTGFNEKDISQFVMQLNQCAAPDEKAVSYYTKPKVSTEFLVYAGGLPLGKQGQITVEGIARICYPQISRKFFVNIGFRYARIVTESISDTSLYDHFIETHQIYCVPLTLQYNILTGRVQPFIYAGVSVAYLKETAEDALVNDSGFQHNYGFAFIVGAGLEVYIVKGLAFRADWRYELLTQFPSIGLSYRFK
ncbi:MAG TPA: hypothetical protein VMH01_07610 [Puia sp.]|nr:hypothetical protein [Puia sp.]